MAGRLAGLGAPVFACTPDQFPALMATALRREGIHAWAAAEDIKLVRPTVRATPEERRRPGPFGRVENVAGQFTL